MRGLCLATLLLMVVAVACAQPAPQASPEVAVKAQASPELADNAAAWEESLNAGDIDSLVAMYAEDARLLPPNAEMAQGHDAVRDAFGGMIAAGLTGSLETTEAMVAADIGYRIGTYTLYGPDGSQADRGKYIETWREVGGEWKISADIWNSDLPAAGPAEATEE